MRGLFFVFVIIIAQSSFASNILFIGDSQSAGYFGKKLDQHLRQNRVVQTFTGCGTVGGSWLQETKIGQTCTGSWGKDAQGKEFAIFKTKPLEMMIQKYRPNMVILQFGGNYRTKTEEEICSDIEATIAAVKKDGAKCFFVTGPDTRAQRDLLPITIERLEMAVNGECDFFNSLEVTSYPKQGGDGYHYYNFPKAEEIANNWADLVFNRFLEIESANSLSSLSNRLNSGE